MPDAVLLLAAGSVLLLLVALATLLYVRHIRAALELAEARRMEAEAGGEAKRKEKGGVAVNQATRGTPPAYAQVGILAADNAGQQAVQKNNILPLFGRQTYARSSNFNYYAQTESGVRIPLSMKGRACEDDLGCAELDSGDKVTIAQLSAEGAPGTYTVSIYKEDGLRYIPSN
jgi:hypothetical protein